MAFDFPASPTEGQIFMPPGGPTYIYHAPAWEVVNVATTGVPEAPVDGSAYGRISAAWQKVLRLVGGTLTGSLGIDTANPTLSLNKEPGANSAQIVANVGGVLRWLIRIGDPGAETGGNAGSDFTLHAADDMGALFSTPAITVNRTERSVVMGKTTVRPHGIEGQGYGWRVTFNGKLAGGNFTYVESGAAAQLYIGSVGLSFYAAAAGAPGATQLLAEKLRVTYTTNQLMGPNYFYGAAYFYNASGSGDPALSVVPGSAVAMYDDLRLSANKTIYTSIPGSLIYAGVGSNTIWVQGLSPYDAFQTFYTSGVAVNFGWKYDTGHFWWGGYSYAPNQYKFWTAYDGPLIAAVRAISLRGRQALQVKINKRWMTVLP